MSFYRRRTDDFLIEIETGVWLSDARLYSVRRIVANATISI